MQALRCRRDSADAGLYALTTMLTIMPTASAARIEPSDAHDLIVFGATGAVGRAVLARLIAAGRRPLCPGRTGRDRLPTGSDWQAFDLYAEQPLELPAATEIVSAGPLDGLAHWLRRCPPQRPVRIAALSSTSAQTKLASNDPSERRLAQRLLDAEQMVIAQARRSGGSATLLRATLIYGNGPDRNLSHWTRLAQKLGRVPMPVWARGRRQPVHADDLAAALLTSLDRTAVAHRILTLPGGETLDYRSMVARHLAVSVPGAGLLDLVRPLAAAAVATLALGPAHWRARAAQLRRTGQDLCFDDGDWRLLDLAPRPFRPEPPDPDSTR